jgi:hypothetical protein
LAEKIKLFIYPRGERKKDKKKAVPGGAGDGREKRGREN